MRVGSRLIIFLVLSALLWGTAAAQSGGDPDRGAELYIQYCSMCHGLDGRGRVGASLEFFPGIGVGEALEQITAQGIEGSVMLAWGEEYGGPLSDEDIADIAAYVSAVIGGTRPIAPAPTYKAPQIPSLPDVSGDPSEGAVVFQNDCAVCHGEQAQGGFGWPLAKDWPSNQPDVYLHQIISRGIDGTAMPAWSQEVGGPLPDQEIDNVTAYLLSLSPPAASPTPLSEPEGPLTRPVSLVIFVVIAGLVVLTLVIYYRRA
jgi:mono/diheme cytochrome c family protein